MTCTADARLQPSADAEGAFGMAESRLGAGAHWTGGRDDRLRWEPGCRRAVRRMGAFRKGGGEVQETVGADVVTLKMPPTARLSLLGMMMAMMAILIASIVTLEWAASVSGGSVTVAASEEAFIVLEAVRRIGVAVYLVASTFGLATITKVPRFQAIRVRELTQLS